MPRWIAIPLIYSDGYRSGGRCWTTGRWFGSGGICIRFKIDSAEFGEGPAWHIPKDAGEDYLSQMTAEQLTEKTNARGAVEQVWKTTKRDNHYGDCEVMQLAQGFLLGAKLKPKPKPKPKPQRAAQPLSRSD